MSDERSEAVELAGALQIKVDDIFAQNSELRAEAESLRATAAALADENAALRHALDQRTRQRDAAMRAADLLDEKMRKIQATSNEAMRAVHPKERALPPAEKPGAVLPMPSPTMNGMATPH